jgi:hypothetical protein
MTESAAIRHSLARLSKSHEALARMEAATVLGEVESAWSDLLLAGNAVYTKLEQGCKGNGEAERWFGRAKNIRKDDRLLSYVHHARNSEEHSIEDVTRRMKLGDATISFQEPFDPKKLEGLQIKIDATSRPGHVLVSSSNEDVVSTKMFDKPSLVLVRVTNRGVHYDPPHEHLGVTLSDQSPLNVGRLFVQYLEVLVEDAKRLGV